MSGGFCEKHGPFDAPHTVCPYCLLEADERAAFGPPQPTQMARSPQTAEVDEVPPPGLTEVIPRTPPDANEVVAADIAFDEDDADFQDSDLPEAPPLDPLGWLVVKQPTERRGVLLPVRHNDVIGREGDVQWNDPRLSRYHARFTVEPPPEEPEQPPCFHLWPFGPTNPVYINGQEARGATALYENDEIRLGDTLFVFKVLMD